MRPVVAFVHFGVGAWAAWVDVSDLRAHWLGSVVLVGRPVCPVEEGGMTH